MRADRERADGARHSGMTTTDLALVAADPSIAEQTADPAQYVMLACERAKEWLGHALDGAHIEEIVEVKSQAEAIRVYTTQKQLGKDAELSAAEVVRRAERGIGQAIRRGQEKGKIARSGDKGATPGPGQAAGGSPGCTRGNNLVSPQSFFRGSNEYNDTYAVTDGVSDVDFDTALNDAKAEGNLSRANVVRKVKGRKSPETRLERAELIEKLAAEGYTSRQMATKAGVHLVTIRRIAADFDIEIPADKLTHKTPNINSTRVARETVFAIEGAAAGLDLIDYDDIDQAEVSDWATSLADSMRAINRFVRKIKEMTQ